MTAYRPAQMKTDGLSSGILERPVGKGQCLTILHAGSKDGFVPNACLDFRGTKDNPDCHKEMNAEVFAQWFNCQFLPNMPSDSLLVMDNASYHSTTVDGFMGSQRAQTEKVHGSSSWMQTPFLLIRSLQSQHSSNYRRRTSHLKSTTLRKQQQQLDTRVRDSRRTTVT